MQKINEYLPNTTLDTRLINRIHVSVQNEDEFEIYRCVCKILEKLLTEVGMENRHRESLRSIITLLKGLITSENLLWYIEREESFSEYLPTDTWLNIHGNNEDDNIELDQLSQMLEEIEININTVAKNSIHNDDQDSENAIGSAAPAA